MDWRSEFIKIISGIYGRRDAERTANTLIGGCFRDFVSMLEKALPGAIISEEYKTEDKKAIIRLEGCKNPSPTLRKISINGREIDLGNGIDLGMVSPTLREPATNPLR